MPYVTSWERFAKEEGRQEGRLEGQQEGRMEGELRRGREDVQEVLAIRFGNVPEEVAAKLAQVVNPATLKSLHRQAVMAASLDVFMQSVELG